MNFSRAVIFVAIALAMVCIAVAFPDPSGGFGGYRGGFGGGVPHGGFSSNVVVARPVVRRVVSVGSGIGSIGGIGGFRGIEGYGRGYGW